MLTDALSKGGLIVPKLEGETAEALKAELFPGSSVANPIDILATGTPEQLGKAIDYCEKRFDNIDAIAVIYGTPGLTTLYQAYEVLHQKIQECKKPIFPILPSLHTAGPEVAEFLAKGHVNFSDEVTLLQPSRISCRRHRLPHRKYNFMVSTFPVSIRSL